MRLSQAIALLNIPLLPGDDDILYTHFTIDEDFKKLRRKYRNNIKKTEKENNEQTTTITNNQN